MSDHDTRFLKPSQVAEILNVSVATLAAWRSQKRGPRFFRPSGRLVRYSLDDVRRFMEGSPVATADQPPDRD